MRKKQTITKPGLFQHPPKTLFREKLKIESYTQGANSIPVHQGVSQFAYPYTFELTT